MFSQGAQPGCAAVEEASDHEVEEGAAGSVGREDRPRQEVEGGGLYNKSACERMVPFDMKKAGLLCKWLVRDVWRQEDVGVFAGVYEASVPGHATHLVRLRPCRCGRLRDDVVDVRDAAWRLLREKDLALRGA